MYWFARRYYAALVRRHASGGGGRLLELGCGLGHLLGLLQDDFRCTGIDLIDYGIEQCRLNAPRAEAFQHDAADLPLFGGEAYSAVVALHVLEHLPDPAETIREVHRLLQPGGIFLFATPHPTYALRFLKDPQRDAIGKDKTHINVHDPRQWRVWCEEAGLRMIKHFGDGLWDVPYLPLIPKALQFAVFGLPAALQVVSRTTWTPLSMGVNQIGIARKP
ncbi:class I SAM-dependent methyltransferase [Aestuariivirga sp.]|uniref:class I SAM-dependent methyltransferase n=1 Tax=Aestuariivirga sp. TaxID=2650926 RepID=UPI00391D4711